MNTISVPLNADQVKFIEETMKNTGQTRAEIMRQALKLYSEEMAIRKILLAEAEPTLSGDLDDLLRQI